MLLPFLALVPSISGYMPAAESAQAAAFMSKFSQYFEYAGPTGAASKVAAAAVATRVAIPEATTSGKCGFWMEDIPHMGVAAFNSNSSYKVFRSVKDYGAKGKHCGRIGSILGRRLILLLQAMGSPMILLPSRPL